MQQIAAENNLAETAFYLKTEEGFEIRWFTPALEVDLCGHATLAAAFVLFHWEGFKGEIIHFQSHRSGELSVRRLGDKLSLNFPSDTFQRTELFPELIAGFGILPKEAYKGKTDYMLVFDNENEIRQLQPDFSLLSKLGARGVIVTSVGLESDFVSRFFAPEAGIDEDPVTGSAHTTLTPYWAKRLGKNELTAVQLSARKGYLECTYLGERVEIRGQARLYLKGEIYVS